MNLNYIFSIILVLVCLNSWVVAQTSIKENTGISFKEVIKEFPRQEKNLRKWDAPVIADLDQDGYPDLLINDHGFGIQVQWNNKGNFAKPYDIIMGDLHGISIGDYDKDGNLEIIMSRGGGSGSNARNSKMFRVTKDREFIELPNFKEPLAMMRGRTVAFIDGDNDGDLDLLNFAFPDSAKKGESENYIYKNDGKGELLLHATLPEVKADGQKTLVTDFNNDSVFDIFMYGNGAVKAYKGNGDLTYTDVSKKLFPEDILDVNAIVEIDFDNDGDFDLYFSRGKDFEIGETFYDENTKRFGFYTKRGEFEFDDLEVGDVLNLENFQSQWPNADTYYIGEASYDYEFEGETHSGKNIKLVNSNALGFPDNANYEEKTGWYIGYVGNKKWKISGYLWAPATGVVSGVENYKESNHQEGLKNLLLENKDKHFEDVSDSFLLTNKEHTTGVAVTDIDNNGFQDLIVLKRGNLIHANEAIVYLNNNGDGFSELENHHIITTEIAAIGMAIETLDYDLDGTLDVVIGNERGKWHLFENNTLNSNNFLTIQIGNSLKNNVSPLGAIVKLTSCKNKQIKRVGSTGASYSLSHNTFIHFGLNNCNQSTDVEVTYTNGDIETKSIDSINQIIKIGK